MKQESAKGSENQSPAQEKGFFQNLNIKKLLFDIAVVIFAVISFSITIYALSITVDYFSFLFSITQQLLAKSYLAENYGQIIGTIYLSIFGQVIVVSNTIIYFTKFTQKNKLLGLHIIFYLPFFICGIVAIAGSPEYLNNMTDLSQNCSSDLFQCQISSSYLSYREQFITFFVIFCICFFIYALIFHLSVKFNDKNEIEAIFKEDISKNQINSMSESKNYDYEQKNRYGNIDQKSSI